MLSASSLHRTDCQAGEDLCELGAGGGHGDLNQQNELEIDDLGVFADLMELCSAKLKCQPQLLTSVKKMLTDAVGDARKKIFLDSTELGVDQTGFSQQDEDMPDLDDIPLDKIVPALAKVVARTKRDTDSAKRSSTADARSELPSRITFPYSRHSSYSELCGLVEIFKPKDIYPCTVDHKGWNPKQSMEYLFGHIYGARSPTFTHDQVMLQHYNDKRESVQNATADSGRFAQETRDHEEVVLPKRDYRTSQRRSATRDSRRRASEEDTDESNPKRRKIDSRGDYWAPMETDQGVPRPPVHVDHYSPPRGGLTSRRPSAAHSRRSDDRADRPPTRNSRSRNRDTAEHRYRSTASKDVSPARHIIDWRRRMSDAQKSSRHPQTEEYGRLDRTKSPTPELIDSPEEEEEEYTILDDDELRFAIQQEAYNAALGNGLDWSEIGLVSVNGHREKEEEL